MASSARVVVVGAGPGGVAAAQRLAELGAGRVDVTLVARDGRAEHLAGTPAVALGQAPVARYVTTIAVGGVTCVAGVAHELGGDGVTVDGKRLEADAVIAAPGLALDSIPPRPAAHAAWDLVSAQRVSADLLAVPGGRLVIAVSSLPYRCPPAPFSLAMQLADHFRRDGRFTKVCVTTPEPFPLAGLGGEAPAFLLDACAGSGVDVERSFEIDDEQWDDSVLRSRDGRELDYELALIVPPHRRSELLDGLPGAGPLVDVGPRGETDVAGLFVIGDAAATGLPRAGGVARALGRTAADAVLARIGLIDEEPPHPPEPSCYVAHGGGNVSRIRVRYPNGVPPTGEAEVSIDGPAPELALAADRERRVFLAAAGEAAAA